MNDVVEQPKAEYAVMIQGKPTESEPFVHGPLTLGELRRLVREATAKGAPDSAVVYGAAVPHTFLQVRWT